MKIELKATTILTCVCPLCGEDGRVRTMEILPDNGLSMECIHKENVRHTWAEFDSHDIITAKQKGREPKIIVCPVCNKKGRINGFTPTGKPPSVVEYVVVHGKIKGTWGKHKSVRRRERCYIKKPEHRIAVLKKLRRYVPPVITLEDYPK